MLPQIQQVKIFVFWHTCERRRGDNHFMQAIRKLNLNSSTGHVSMKRAARSSNTSVKSSEPIVFRS